MAQTVTIGKQKVSPESESLKFSATLTPQVQNPCDSTALVATLVWTTSAVIINYFRCQCIGRSLVLTMRLMPLST